MDWTRINSHAEASDQGHRVSASKSVDGWAYSAWSPEACPGLTDRQWQAQAHTREHYPRGEQAPQRRRLLGIYPSAEQARARCEQDAASAPPGDLQQP
jgi:hypothetical protein